MSLSSDLLPSLLQHRPVTPWAFVISDEACLTCNIIARGPFPANVMHMLPTRSDLTEFGDEISAGMRPSDALMLPAYPGEVRDRLLGLRWDESEFLLYRPLFLFCFAALH